MASEVFIVFINDSLYKNSNHIYQFSTVNFQLITISSVKIHPPNFPCKALTFT